MGYTMKWLLAFLCLLSQLALGFVSASFNAPAYIVAPGGTIQLTITLQSDEPLLGVGYRFAGEHLSILSRDITGSPFTDVITSEVRGAFGPDLGALVDNLSIPAPAGSNFVASYFLAVDPTAPIGAYKITLGPNSVAVNSAFESVPIFAGADVLLVPEPSCAVLLLIGTALLLRKQP